MFCKIFIVVLTGNRVIVNCEHELFQNIYGLCLDPPVIFGSLIVDWGGREKLTR